MCLIFDSKELWCKNKVKLPKHMDVVSWVTFNDDSTFGSVSKRACPVPCTRTFFHVTDLGRFNNKSTMPISS